MLKIVSYKCYLLHINIPDISESNWYIQLYSFPSLYKYNCLRTAVGIFNNKSLVSAVGLLHDRWSVVQYKEIGLNTDTRQYRTEVYHNKRNSRQIDSK